MSDLYQQLNLIYKKDFKVIYGDFTSTKMEVSGASSGSLNKYISNFFESRLIYNHLFYNNGFVFALIRLLKNLLRRIGNIGTFFK